MPVIPSTFHPPFFLLNGHVQTITGALLPRRVALDFTRERLELPDGDFLDLDWAASGRNRVAVLSHGLEGSSRGRYIRGMAAALNTAGWDVAAWNFRGCSEESNRLPGFYHSGATGDLRSVVEHAAAKYRRIVLVGFSLGGNLTLKYLGEAPPHPAVVAAAAVSAPVDLASSALKLDRKPGNSIYLRRFLKTLIARIEAKALRFPDRIQTTGIRAIRSFEEFDNRYTGPLHGFRDAADYWEKSSSRPLLKNIRIPALLLNARNDPFLAPECFPFDEAGTSPFVTLEAPESGGHVGFVDLHNGFQPWSERRIIAFLQEDCGAGA